MDSLSAGLPAKPIFRHSYWLFKIIGELGLSFSPSSELEFWSTILVSGFLGGSVVKNPPTNAGDERDSGLIPGSGRSPRVENGNPLQYSCLENPMDGGA